MNILQQLVADAQQKKQQLQNSIGQAAHTVVNDVSHIGAAPTPPPLPRAGQPGFGVVRPGASVMPQPHFSTQQLQQWHPAAPVHPSLQPHISGNSFGAKLGNALINNPISNALDHTANQVFGGKVGLQAEQMVGGAAQSLIRGGMALPDKIGNAEVGIAHMMGKAPNIKTQTGTQFANNSIGKTANKAVGYTGTGRQVALDAINNASWMLPGAGKAVGNLAERAGVKVADQAAPVIGKTLSRAAGNVASKLINYGGHADIGGATTAIQGAANEALNNPHANIKTIATAAKDSFIPGALMGGAVPLAHDVAPVIAKGGKRIIASQDKVAANQNIDIAQHQLEKQAAAIQKQKDALPFNSDTAYAHNNYQAKLDHIEAQHNNLEAQRPVVTKLDKVLATQPGMTVGGPNALKYQLAKKAGRTIESSYKDLAAQGVHKVPGLSNEKLDSLSPEAIDALKSRGFKGVSNGKRTIRFDEQPALTVYHGGAGVDEMTKNGVKILSPEDKLKYPSSGGGYVGLSTTADKNYAKQYSQSIAGHDRVAEMKIKPDARIHELPQGQAIDDMSADELTALSKRYDVIKSPEDNEYRILNEGALQSTPTVRSQPNMSQDTKYSLGKSSDGHGISDKELQDIVATHRNRFGDTKVQVGNTRANVRGSYGYEQDLITLAKGDKNLPATHNHESIHKAIGQFLSDGEIKQLYRDIASVRGGKRGLQQQYRGIGYKGIGWQGAAEEEIANHFNDFMADGRVTIMNSKNKAYAIAKWAAYKGLPQSVVRTFLKLAQHIDNFTQKGATQTAAAQRLESFYRKVDSGGFNGATRRTSKFDNRSLPEKVRHLAQDTAINAHYHTEMAKINLGIGMKSGDKLMIDDPAAKAKKVGEQLKALSDSPEFQEFYKGGNISGKSWNEYQRLSKEHRQLLDSIEKPTAAPKATPAPALPEPSDKRQLPASRGTGGVSSAKPTIEPPARNADAERTALEKLQNGGTNDEAVYAYMKSTGKGLQESVKAVGKAANEAGLTSDGGKNPLLGSVKVPKVQEGDFAQAHHNANYVQGHEQRVGNQATQSFKSLSAKDQNLLRDIEAKPVEEVAKGADNPQAFTQAAKDIRTYYDTRHAYDNYLGMDVGYRANYLRHIFDKADQAASDSQIAIKNGTKTPGYTKARSKDSIASDVLDTLQRDIKGSSYNHAKLTYEKGLNEAFPDKIANGQAVATPTDGQYDQIHHPFGKALFAPKDVAHDINSRTWQQTDSKALETYDKINRGLKYTKLSGGLFHAFTEAGNFAGQQLASGKMLTNPAATGRLAKVFFSKGAMDGEMTRLEANGVADNARLAGLTTTAKEILADAHVGAIDRMKESRWNPLKQMHDATFQREIPYAKMKIFEQKTAGLDAHNPKDLAKMRQVARETNQIFGGIDRMTSGIKPGTFKWLQRGLLATDFTEGKWHTLSDALTSKGPAGNLARQTVAGKAVLFGILATAGGAASGEYNGKSPGDIAKNAAGNLLDPSFQAGSYTAKLPKTHISEAIDAVKPYAQAKGAPWNASGLVHYGQARSAALPSEAIQLLSNKDYYGQPIYGKNTKKAGGGPISPAKVGLNVVNTVAPIPFGQGVSTAQGKQNLPAAIANVAGLNVRQTPANKTATGNTPVDKLKATEKQQNTDLKNSLSAEDYKLSQLSKADRQKLINNGSYTADKFKGLDNYVANEKKQLGMNTGTSAIGVSAKISPHSQKVLGVYNSLNADQNKQKAYSEPSWDYKVAQAKYDNAVANGTLSKAQAISQKQAVQKAKVGSGFSKDTRDLYGLSKQEVYDLITTDPNGKKYAADLLAYGDALKAAGIEKNKFRTSKGVESFGDGTNSATKASSGSKTSLSTLLAGFKTPYSDMVKNSTKGASLARNAHLSKKKA